jgi:hypothetical protein
MAALVPSLLAAIADPNASTKVRGRGRGLGSLVEIDRGQS